MFTSHKIRGYILEFWNLTRFLPLLEVYLFQVRVINLVDKRIISVFPLSNGAAVCLFLTLGICESQAPVSFQLLSIVSRVKMKYTGVVPYLLKTKQKQLERLFLALLISLEPLFVSSIIATWP